MECASLRSLSRFLKWTRTVSPTRALISGPGMWPVPLSRLSGSGRFQPFV
jgi:hypothetical protein